MPDVQGAEARRTVRGRIRTGPAQWGNLIVFVRPDFETSRIGTVELESGAWPSGTGDIAIERDALQVARAKVGDVVTVRTETGSERPLRVSGSVHDVGQAQARMENMVYGYVSLKTLAALGEEPYYNELAIRVSQRPLDEAHIHDVANAAAGTLEKSGRHVVRIDVPEPGRHPHATLMAMLTLSNAIFGFFILALSGVIVFNVLTALLAGQRRQIGVMKAVGGTRSRISRVYLMEAGLLGVTAVAVALPIGLIGGRWLCQWMAMLLNFDIASFAMPPWIYALVLAVGVAVPVIAAVIPVLLGTRVSVREALTANSRSGRAYGTSMIDRALARFSGLSRVLLLAIRNAGRNRLRVALTLVTLAAGGIFFMSALNVRQSMINTVDRFFQTSRADLSVSLASDYPVDAVERAARGTAGVSAAEGWTVVAGAILPSSTDSGQTFTAKRDTLTVNGLPPGSRMMALDISNGEGLDGGARGVVVNTALFDRLGRPAMGAEVHFQVVGKDASLLLLGVAREPFSPPAAYVSRAFFENLPNAGTVNSLQISLASSSSASLDAAKADVEASLERWGIRAVQASTKAERRIVYDMHFLMIYVFLIAVSCILGGVGALGLVTTVSLNVTERRREMGVLRAIGATPARVAQIVVIEGAAVGAMAWLVAMATVAPLSKVIGNLMLRLLLQIQTEITFAIDPKGVVIWLIAAIAGSALASLLPARQASRASVRDALSYE
jgi:putative ABC transport system permease protein